MYRVIAGKKQEAPMVEAQRGRESRREEILAAAIRSFALRGFEGTSTREIAREADAKQPLIFYHFGSKADLYLAAVLYQLDRLHEGLDAALAGATDDIDRLNRFVHTYYDHFTVHEPGLGVCLRELSGLPDSLPEKIAAAHRDAATATLEEIIRSGVSNGTFRPLDAESCMFAIIGILQGFLRLRRSTRARIGSVEPVQQVLGVYVKGLLTEEAREERRCASISAAVATP
jgi:AcrR family transcriptional regulator